MIFLKKAAIISGVFISGLIGAGFATGSEIYFYFSRFGMWGIAGVFLAVLIFAFMQYAVLNQAHIEKTFTIDEYFKKILKKPLCNLVSAFSYMFMIFILSAMMSGFGEMMYEMYGIKKLFGAVLMLVCTIIIVKKGYNGFVSTQSILSVAIVLIIGGVCFYILSFGNNQIEVFNPQFSWAGSAVCYTGYNMLTAVAVLCILAKDTQKKTSVFSALITFVILVFLMAVMWYIIFKFDGIINLGSMPILRICMYNSNNLAIIYSLAVFFSMLTTAVSSAYALSVKYSGAFGEYILYAVSFFLSGFDFSFIVDRLYRLGGMLSFILIIGVILKEIKYIKLKERN